MKNIRDEKWNDNWRNELEEKQPKVYERLCNCINKKTDILVIAKYIYLYNKENYTKQECLERTIQWLTDWNNQVELIPTNFKWYLSRI